ncbi:MAG: hypothetical protein P4L16_06930 [Chlamydiales bacterium]|nr:hypothetical protein [Chlamydiales bacterium]
MLQRVEKRIEFWAALGPFIILSAFLIGVFRLSPQLFLMPAMSLVVLPICWKWDWKGLYWSLALLFCVCLFILVEGTFYERIWGLSIAVVLSAGLVVTLFSFSEVKKIALLFHNEARSQLEENVFLKENLQEVLEEYKRELVGVAEEVLQKNNELAKLRIKFRVQEKDLLQLEKSKSLLIVEKENVLAAQQDRDLIYASLLKKEKSAQEALQATITGIQNERDLIAKDLESCMNEIALLKSERVIDVAIPSKEEDIELLYAEIKALKEKDAMYKQLRVQFEEKSQVLSQTRVELFELEGKYLALQKEVQEGLFSDDSYLKRLVKLIHIQEKEKTSLEREVNTLQEIISELM